MARVRSPNYPAVGLGEAIERVRRVHEAAHQVAEPKEVMAKYLGYGGINGGSLKMISALLKYGLFEDAEDGQLRVSDRTIQILYPEDDEQKAQAIHAAAFSPSLWSEIRDRWKDVIPSDESLKAYLVRNQFAQSAIDGVISSYKDTLDLVTRETRGYDVGNGANKNQDQQGDSMQSHHEQKQRDSRPAFFTPPNPKAPQTSEGEPFRVTFTGAGIEIVGRLTKPEDADELVKAVNALKMLMKPSEPVGSKDHLAGPTGKPPEEDGLF